ncbi:MAG: hypothetical protein DRQ10_08045 [Candidatus Hydrothermota bacterium]|nr:MAG: hypothetical protein DRQ10_08045 [Candidatus Hydrothermae bacterium]
MRGDAKDPERWLSYAKEDLFAAEKLIEFGSYRASCFHAHQAVEKALKALIVRELKQVPKTHDLPYLWGIVVKEKLSDLTIEPKMLSFLNLIYASSRYPDDFGLMPHGEPTKEDAERAVAYAKEIFDKILKVMGYDQR